MTNETLLRTMFGAEDHLWSVGTLGAFMALPVGLTRLHGEALILSAPGFVARLRPGGRLLAFETLSSAPRGWNHGIALCLPAPADGGPRTARLRLVGDAPILPAGAEEAVFDLGLGQGPVRVLFRPQDASTRTLRRAEGLCWAEAAPQLAQMPGTWIIDTPILRVERQMSGGIGLHSLPQALVTGRRHAQTTPVPPGMMPVAHVFPPHPARRCPGEPADFDPARHRRFQSILARHGRADLGALKATVLAQLAARRCDPPVTDRHGATAVRVTLRQHLRITGEVPRDWLARFDRPLLRLLEQEGPGWP